MPGRSAETGSAAGVKSVYGSDSAASLLYSNVKNDSRSAPRRGINNSQQPGVRNSMIAQYINSLDSMIKNTNPYS